MKKLFLILIMVGFLCPANGYSQADSIKIMEKLNQLEQVTNQTKVLLKKADQLEKQKRNLIERLRTYISKLKTDSKEQRQEMQTERKNNAAVKAQNINEPVVEITVPDGYDTIRASFFYRLFHQNSYILKPYKIVNDEKIYLD